MTEVEQFRDAIRSAGLEPPAVIEADGKLRRFASNGKRGDDAGWYVLHADDIPAGKFGDWRTGFSKIWRADIGRDLTPHELARHRQTIEAMEQARKAEQAKRHAEAQAKAATIWKGTQAAPADHSYLTIKGIKAHGVRLHDRDLVIPMRDENAATIHSLQFISPGGQKLFLPGGRVSGCYYSIGKPDAEQPLCIAEGFATAATVHEATGYPVAVAFNAGNLEPVTLALKAKFPHSTLILCADDDVNTEGNPGLTKATAAAQTANAKLAIPDFGSRRPADATDFNDMAAHCGVEAVARAIEAATFPRQTTEWSEPQPIAASVTREPYPLDALPQTIKAAVVEVQSFTKAPIPLVASSALGAISLALQGQFDVERAKNLSGPISLYLLTVADSGERKSTCDSYFMAPVREYEAQQAEAAKPILREHRAARGAWEAKCNGVKDKIRQLAKQQEPTGDCEAALRDIEHEEPKAPRIPRLIYEDVTTEKLRQCLATEWPCGGIVSAEAGIIFGSHSMSKDKITLGLTTLNVLWDGRLPRVDRSTVESFNSPGARLTLALQVQEPTLRSFLDRSGGLVRGSGFLARFLIAWPESTQGFRRYTDPPETWPALDKFKRVISERLNQPVSIDEKGLLSPATLPLTPDAKAAWIQFHDAIESELAAGGELYEVRDAASKSADNAARLAALFQVLEQPGSGAVGLEALEGACRIAAWHLNETRRFLGELALSPETVNAGRLDRWLIEYCIKNQTGTVSRRDVQRLGPNPAREGPALDAALKALAEAGRSRNSGQEILVNPALLERSSI